MRLRLRYADKQEVATLADSATLIELLSLINETATEFDPDADLNIKFGYPPQSLQIADNELTPVSELGIKNGESLLVEYTIAAAAAAAAAASQQEEITEGETTSKTDALINPDKIPYIELQKGYLILHKVPDDNSCLFHAILRSTDSKSFMSVHDLRTICANAIRDNKQGIYSEAILGKPVAEYCDWILNPQAWGGEIEIDILARFLNVEIVTVDIESQHSYKFNEGAEFVILLAYSGVHYDSIVYQESKNLTSLEFAIGKFDKFDLQTIEILENYQQLINVLNIMGLYTNTKTFKLTCGDCGKTLQGEKDASEHASETGHLNFQEKTK